MFFFFWDKYQLIFLHFETYADVIEASPTLLSSILSMRSFVSSSSPATCNMTRVAVSTKLGQSISSGNGKSSGVTIIDLFLFEFLHSSLDVLNSVGNGLEVVLAFEITVAGLAIVKITSGCSKNIFKQPNCFLFIYFFKFLPYELRECCCLNSLENDFVALSLISVRFQLLQYYPDWLNELIPLEKHSMSNWHCFCWKNVKWRLVVILLRHLLNVDYDCDCYYLIHFLQNK